jgi:hypothetical protein
VFVHELPAKDHVQLRHKRCSARPIHFTAISQRFSYTRDAGKTGAAMTGQPHKDSARRRQFRLSFRASADIRKWSLIGGTPSRAVRREARLFEPFQRNDAQNFRYRLDLSVGDELR